MSSSQPPPRGTPSPQSMENVVTPPASPGTSVTPPASPGTSKMDSDGSTSTTASKVAEDEADMKGAIEYNKKKIKQEKREYNRLLAKCTPANIGAALAAEIQADFSQVPYELSESESEAENPSDVLPSPAGYNKPPDHDEDPPSTGITVVCSSCSSALANQAVKY